MDISNSVLDLADVVEVIAQAEVPSITAMVWNVVEARWIRNWLVAVGEMIEIRCTLHILVSVVADMFFCQRCAQGLQRFACTPIDQENGQ